MKITPILAVLVGSLFIQTGALASADDEFCIRSQGNIQSQLISETENRIAFTNQGGIFNGGVCWWHSRLQRAATYLAVFKPNLPKPVSSQEAFKILRKLKSLKEVVEIPGYKNFFEFTEAWKRTTQKFLNRWQIDDAVLHQAWIRGLAGSPRADAYKLQQTMMRLKNEVQEMGRISYLKLQLKGIVAHAWLVYGIEPITHGMRLLIIDSNNMNVMAYEYYWGDAAFETNLYGQFMPYLEQTEDFKSIELAIADYCP